MSQCIVLLAYFITKIVCVLSYESVGELVFAHVLFRHGDRTPVDPYPNDPWKDLSNWPTGFGQLTNIGKQQQLELGRFLRKRYSGFIPDTFNSKEIYVRSTDVDRTLMSAQSNLAGLYPPVGSQIWDKELEWQPIPVHTTPEKSDSLLAAKKFCFTYDMELKRVKASEEYQRMDAINTPLYKYLTKNSGRLVSSLEGVENIYNCLYIEELYNKTLPGWTKSVYPDKMRSVAARSFVTNTYTNILKRYKTGPLLKEILGHFVNKTIGKMTERKLWIYSAHDTTVANLLNTLGVFEIHNPPYIACVMLELRKIQDQFYVQVFYRNDSNSEPRPMYLPGCGTLCLLNKMIILYRDVVPVDWEAECQPSQMLASFTSDSNVIAALAIVAVFLLVVLLLSALIVGFTYWRHKNKPDNRYQYLRLNS